jgi:hypothetical protein
MPGMPTNDHAEARTDGYFAETAVGAVVLLSLQFLSLPVLIGGLALIGLVKLVSRLRTAGAG